VNLTLAYLWKEWRAQRGMLIAYTLLVFGCLGILFQLLPTQGHRQFHLGYHALSWFVAAGVIGVVVFAVPRLVQGELAASKGEQFVQRLPDALWSAFWGKLLFLLLVSVSLPLLGLSVGMLYLWWCDQGWELLFGWSGGGVVSWSNHPVLQSALLAMLMVPWIWAAATWMPGGRLSLLATGLLALSVGIGVVAVLRQCPKVLDGFDWVAWSWTLPLSGLVAAALSWGRGRRGGGPLRSARIGLAATGAMLVPGGAWLGTEAWRYHNPRFDRLQKVEVVGSSEDGRFVLCRGSENAEWYGVHLRIDLETGEARKVAGYDSAFGASIVRPFRLELQAMQDLWGYHEVDGRRAIYDLAADEWTEVEWDDENGCLDLPEDLRQRVWEQRQRTTPFRAAGGARVWLEPGAVCFEGPNGVVERQPWPFDPGNSVWPQGHSLQVVDRKGFDLHSRDELSGRRWSVAGRTLFPPGVGGLRRSDARSEWFVAVGEAEPVVCAPLRGAQIVGLLDDEHVIAREGGRLFRFAPRSGAVDELAITLPSERSVWPVHAVAPMFRRSSLMERDPWGCVWLLVSGDRQRNYVRLDPETLEVLPVGDELSAADWNLLWWNERGVVVSRRDGARIERFSPDFERCDVLFPREVAR